MNKIAQQLVSPTSESYTGLRAVQALLITLVKALPGLQQTCGVVAAQFFALDQSAQIAAAERCTGLIGGLQGCVEALSSALFILVPRAMRAEQGEVGAVALRGQCMWTNHISHHSHASCLMLSS